MVISEMTKDVGYDDSRDAHVCQTFSNLGSLQPTPGSKHAFDSLILRLCSEKQVQVQASRLTS